MTYKGNQIDYRNLNDNLKTKIDKAEEVKSQIQALIPKIDNSWQKGVYNETSVTNLGQYVAARVIYFSDWDADNSKSDAIFVDIPIKAYSGLIKLTLAGDYKINNSMGGAEVTYQIGKVNDTSYEYSKTIMSISSSFASSFYIGDVVYLTDRMYIPITKAPNSRNPLTIKIELISITNNAFTIINGIGVARDSAIVQPNPWTRQTSNIPSSSQMNFWDRSMWNDIVDGRQFLYGGVSYNLGTFKPAQLRDFLQVFLVNKMGTFKCFVNTTDVGASSINGYGVLTTIKPWLDESGGGLTQKFETVDTIQKRFQVDDNTWSPWVTIQNKDVDVVKLFQSVSNGKKQVANAITQKGVPTSPDAEFATMANNIKAIETGKKVDVLVVNIPALSAGGATSVGVATLFQPVNAMINLDGVCLRNGALYGTNWANKHSVYNVRTIYAGNGLWNTYFDVRAGQFSSGEQYNLAILTT